MVVFALLVTERQAYGFLHEWPVISNDSSRCSLDEVFRLSESGDIALKKFCFAPVFPKHVNPNLIDVGDVVPDALVLGGAHHRGSAPIELDYLIDVVGSPIKNGAS